jgi:hypothetical protein
MPAAGLFLVPAACLSLFGSVGARLNVQPACNFVFGGVRLDVQPACL